MAFRHDLSTERASGPLSTFRSEMNDFFDRFSREWFPESESGNFMPRVELKDNGTTYTLSAELPGLKEEDINISLEDNTIFLRGERKNEIKREGKGFYRSEFSYGSFYRAIPLASDVNPDTVSATYADGVLTVTLDKVPATETRARKIPIGRVTESSPGTSDSSKTAAKH